MNDYLDPNSRFLICDYPLRRRRFLAQTGAALIGGAAIYAAEEKPRKNSKADLRCTSDPVSVWNNAHRDEPDFREKEFGAKGPKGTVYSLPLVYLDDEKSYALQISAFPYLAKRNDTGSKLNAAVRFTPGIYHLSTKTLIAERTVVGSASVSATGKSNPNKIHISTNVSFNSMGRIDFVNGQCLPAGMTAWALYFNHTPRNNTNAKGPVELDLECFVEVYGKRDKDGKRTIAGSVTQSCRWTIERLGSEQVVAGQQAAGRESRS